MFAVALFAPIHATFGVAAVLTVPGHVPLALTALDKTSGVTLANDAGDVFGTTPVAEVLAGALSAAGIEVRDLRGATLALIGQTWTVDYGQVQPTPFGSTDGQVMLALSGPLV